MTPRHLLLLAGLLAWPAAAHDLRHTVESQRAVVVRLFYADNTPFTFEGYEIYRDGDKLPYQVGRTDGQGRAAFLPDQPGHWRFKAISQDGHGLDVRLETGADAVVQASAPPPIERYGRILAGVALILGLFGIVKLFLRRKERP